MQKKYAKIAGIAFIIALICADSPVWIISFIAIVIMGAAVVRGQLWDYEKENEK